MDRVFLDANVLFSAAYRADSGLRQLWKLKNVALCSSRHALEEAMVNLEEEEQRHRLKELSESLQFFAATETRAPEGVSLPEKDIPILMAAIEGDADYLLTGDIRHFGAPFGRKIEGVAIMVPAEYLTLIRRQSKA